eukprot:GHVT01054032.1.p1 GENE.GHVT01054032.1~~GHVT01054032.1.p1  ORF type:complete len:363 (+),score=98.83 GHVT01054032.1:381-1469(+)
MTSEVLGTEDVGVVGGGKKVLGVLGLGNPLLDVIANVSKGLLEKYGLTMNNAILAEEQHLPLFDEIKQGPHELAVGGATQNSMRICKALLGKEGAVSYIGCVGKDENGEEMRRLAKEEGVEPLYAVSGKSSTGVCAVLVHGCERSLCTKLGAANDYPLDHLNYKVWDAVEMAHIVYSAGYFLTVCPEGMLLAAEHCSKNNKTFAFNLSATFLVEFFKEPLMKLLPYADVVFGNESEFLHLAKVHDYAEGTDLVKIAAKVALLPKVNATRPRVVVVTQGPDPTIVATSWVGCGAKVMLLPPPLVEAAKVVDTNGAGDAFVGGFLFGLARRFDVEKCVYYGNLAGAHVIQKPGCTFNFEAVTEK